MNAPRRPMAPNPGRLAPADQRQAAETFLEQETALYREAEARWHAAIVKVTGPPVDVPNAEGKSLVPRLRIQEITGMTPRKVAELVAEAKEKA
ncbi:hypothetical protein ACIBKY_51310 [Nonomuraea sp. NPDC050394]|uniref:hypothetical protein n=1 Tax=Nonomuraea sp. NPDC050394 TaxID=3364363 RepID=UPI0037A284E8